MPSDERSRRLLQELVSAREPFRSAVVTAAEQVRRYLDAQRSPNAQPEATEELGSFASGRIDSSRFTSLFRTGTTLEPTNLVRLRWALTRLNEIATGVDELLRVSVEPGWDLRDAVGRAFSRVGRAFGAAQTVELLRTGRFRMGRDESLLDDFPFKAWNRAERQIAPPLVVEIDGKDLRAGGLAEYLDGSVRIIVLVRSESSPAPLARLITPGVFVMQTAVEEELSRIATVPGPGVAALVPQGAAEFVHDPSAGAALADRLTIKNLPTGEVRRGAGGQSAFQQAEELAMLAELAHLAAAAPRLARSNGNHPAGAEVESVQPADRLASWLLSQVDLTDIG